MAKKSGKVKRTPREEQLQLLELLAFGNTNFHEKYGFSAALQGIEPERITATYTKGYELGRVVKEALEWYEWGQLLKLDHENPEGT